MLVKTWTCPDHPDVGNENRPCPCGKSRERVAGDPGEKPGFHVAPGELVLVPSMRFAGVVARVHGAGEFRDRDGRVVSLPVVEFEDGTTLTAPADEPGKFVVMSEKAAKLQEIAARVVGDVVRLLAEHAKAFGLNPGESADVIASALSRQAAALRKGGTDAG
jgi:hypothetical protein